MTAIGLVVALVAPLIYTLIVDPYLFGEDFDPTGRALVGYVVMWSLAGTVLAFTVFGERRPLSTIGFRPLSLPLIAVGVGAGVAMAGTLTPLVLSPDQIWSDFPFVLTLEGQYIIKNAVLISAGFVIGATARGGRLVEDPVDTELDGR